MRVLLDECLPRKLRQDLSEFSVKTVVEMGWGGIKNGELLQKAESEFDVFLTADQNMKYQQNTNTLPLPVIVMVAYSNDINVLRPLMPKVSVLIPRVEAGQVYEINAQRQR